MICVNLGLTYSIVPLTEVITIQAGFCSTARERIFSFSSASFFDLMISLLARSHSFLRETANYVFKSFCSDLDEDSLDQLIKIISTPNEKAAEMFEQGSDDEDYGEESGDDKEVDISDDSDDSI